MPRILVVEDEPNINKFIALNLRARSYDVLQAESAEEALELMKQFTPQALILDIKLPNMDGWTMLQTIDHEPALPKVPVIVMTASSMLNQPEYPYTYIVDKLVKPVSVTDLLRAVSKVFQAA